ncbi:MULTISPECIES: hypothetical protein [unclassified Streptomyces]|uniref:hypothetical protein n=1 Tax=unclassified Streptomyces TaxID=2593676 RepID=UPI0033DE400C
MDTNNTRSAVRDLTTLPESSVPAAFDRGHLYSPTLGLTRYALDDRYAYDYRPGDLYEPMPEAPREPKAFLWWSQNIASQPVPDFLGLRVGDRITVHHVSSVGPGEVIKTLRRGAVVRYPLPVISLSTRTHSETYVRRRNTDGHWY